MRKVLSFVLVLALVLSSFSMAFADTTPAAVTTTPAVTTPAPVVAPVVAPAPVVANVSGLSDISGIVNEEAVKVVNNLGIVTGNPDGTFAPEKAVNRAEFAAMITRALGIPESALAGYTKANFKDVNGYGWAVPYLAFCESKGIMKGDGLGNAMPGRTINTNEAATMICRALGYTDNSSVLVGMWPSNYVSLAQDLGVYDDVAKDPTVEKGDAAQMIYNALTVQKVQVAADGTTKSMEGKDGTAITMLTSGLGCEDKGYAVVSYDEEALINTLSYVGVYAKRYENNDGDLVAIDDIKTTALKGKFYNKANPDTAQAVDFANEYYFKADGVKYSIDAFEYSLDKTTTRSTVKFLNADGTATFAPQTKTTYTLNVKTANKDITDVYSIEKEIITSSDKVEAGDVSEIKNGKLLGVEFATDKKDNIITKSFELVGVASLSDIKADDIVYVYSENNDNSNEIRKVAVGRQIVEGKVVKANTTDEEWTIGDKVYCFSDEKAHYTKDELNNEVKCWLDAYGDIYDYETVTGSTRDYAVVVDEGNFGQAKLYLADDSKKVFNTDLDATKLAVIDKADNKRLIGYGLDKDGVIDGVYPASAGEATANQLSSTNTTLAGIKVLKTEAAPWSFVVDDKVTVFTYKDSTHQSEITGIAKIADIDTNEDLGNVEFLTKMVSGTNKVVAMIIDEKFVGGGSADVYAVVGLTNDVVVNDHKAQAITGYVGDKAANGDVYTSSLDVIGTSSIGNPMEIVKVNYNSDKEISRVTTKGSVNNTFYALKEKARTGDAYMNLNTLGLTSVAGKALFIEAKYNDDNTFDKYASFNGTMYLGTKVYLYETDDDVAGYDIVIVDTRDAQSAYAMTATFAPTNATIASNAAANTVVTTITPVANASSTFTYAWTVKTSPAGITATEFAAQTTRDFEVSGELPGTITGPVTVQCEVTDTLNNASKTFEYTFNII